jgi:hypothetical protein
MRNKDESLLVQFSDPESQHRVMLEDDGRVAYAYLLKADEILGDVWLYNYGEPPVDPEWTDQSAIPTMPLRNPRGFALDTRYPPIADYRDVRVAWIHRKDEPVMAEVYLRGTLHALLQPGARPGWCKLAAKDGPLAKILPSKP